MRRLLLVLFFSIPLGSLSAAPISIPNVDVRPDSFNPTNRSGLIDTSRDSSLSNLLQMNPAFQLDFDGKQDPLSGTSSASRTRTTYLQLLYGLYDHLDTSLFVAAFSQLQYWQLEMLRNRHDAFDWNKEKIFNSQHSEDSLRLSHNLVAASFSMRNLLAYSTYGTGLQSNPFFSLSSGKAFNFRNIGKYAFSSVRSLSLNLDYDFHQQDVSGSTNEVSSEKHSLFAKTTADIFANDVYAFSADFSWYYQHLGIPRALEDSHQFQLSTKNEFSSWEMFRIAFQLGVRLDEGWDFVGELLCTAIPFDFAYFEFGGARIVDGKWSTKLMENGTFLLPQRNLLLPAKGNSGFLRAYFLFASKVKADIGAEYLSYDRMYWLRNMQERLYIVDRDSFSLLKARCNIHFPILTSLIWNAKYLVAVPLDLTGAKLQHQLETGISYLLPGFEGTVAFKWSENGQEDILIPNMNILDFGISLKFRIQKSLWCLVQGSNLLNSEEFVANGYREAPLSVSLGLRFDL